ncbi:MAG: alkaline phosphatase family protein [Firmicutes bacterium]|nr:alkaline phosphatase family protein [Bacillota bacterium]
MNHRKIVLLGLDGAVPTLIEEYVAQGLLPHFKQLMEGGYYTRALSSFPGVTPINWACISTGAYPGTHGIVDFEIHEPGEPLNTKHGAFSSDKLLAETLWESLGRQGYRTATINFPGSWPPRTSQAITVAGEGSPASHSRFELRASACFATNGLRPSLRDADPLQMPYDVIHLIPEWDAQGYGPTIAVHFEQSESGPRIRIRSADHIVEPFDYICEIGHFSPWFQGQFVVHGTTRIGFFRVLVSTLQVRSNTPELSLYVSQIMPIDGISQPEFLGRELIGALGPMIENSGGRGYERGWVNDEIFVEEGMYKGQWLVRATQYLLSQNYADAIFVKWHFLDHLQHLFWGQIDPISPWYQSGQAAHFESLFQAAYRAADDMVGRILTTLAADDILVVVSDHGHIAHLRAVSMNNLLMQEGFIHLKNRDPIVVDWDHTLAYAGPCLGHIHINLRGRDPQGIVDPQDYQAVQQRLIQTLTTFTDSETGQHPVQLAIPIDDGVVFGQWGPRAGDVLYFMEAGYTGDVNWFPLTSEGTVLLPMSRNLVATADYGEGKFIASKFQSAHGCGLPSRRLGRGTEEAVLCIRAQEFQSHPLTHRTGVQLVDVAPTVSALLGVSPPRHAQGRVL